MYLLAFKTSQIHPTQHIVRDPMTRSGPFSIAMMLLSFQSQRSAAMYHAAAAAGCCCRYKKVSGRLVVDLLFDIYVYIFLSVFLFIFRVPFSFPSGPNIVASVVVWTVVIPKSCSDITQTQWKRVVQRSPSQGRKSHFPSGQTNKNETQGSINNNTSNEIDKWWAEGFDVNLHRSVIFNPGITAWIGIDMYEHIPARCKWAYCLCSGAKIEIVHQFLYFNSFYAIRHHNF